MALLRDLFIVFLNMIVDDDQAEQKLNKLSDKKLTDHPTLLNEVSNTQSNSKNYQVGIIVLKLASDKAFSWIMFFFFNLMILQNISGQY